jgi:predicted ATPase
MTTFGRPSGALPRQPTPLLDRATELEVVRRLLVDDGVRLVSLTGPGGAGKTHLALATGESLAGHFSHGVAFVDLAAIRDPALVPQAIARAVGVRAGAQLMHRLARLLCGQHRLLVLDNFEQLVPAAPLLNQLLDACPRLVLLVTSRQPLRLRAEYQFRVPPLRVPDANQVSAELEQPSPALALFVERARRVRPSFELTTGNAPILAELCRRLDGLPLAIELAAAEVSVMEPEAILGRLRHRLSLLPWKLEDVPERHRTLHVTFAWSYDLLDTPEQSLFRRLGVFVGGWTAAAAAAVAETHQLGLDALEGLSSLTSKNLVQLVEPPDVSEPRFRMLETVREFALEQLAATKELEDTRWRHAQYFLGLIERPARDSRGLGRWVRLGLGDGVSENLGVALAGAVERDDTALALRLAAALRRFHLGLARGEGNGQAASGMTDVLSEREREVLSLLTAGLSTQQIAEQLIITPRTAKFHVSSILSKLGAANRVQAVLLALQHGLVDMAG